MSQLDDQGGLSSNQDATSGFSAGKRQYQQPKLTVHGSVRELTGGSSGPNSGDGSLVMQMP